MGGTGDGQPVCMLSAHFHKYDDVCCERDAPGFQARRRGDAGTSAKRSHTEDRGVPSALRVAAGRADSFVAPPPLWQGIAFVVASRTPPVALATKVAVFRFQCTKELDSARCLNEPTSDWRSSIRKDGPQQGTPAARVAVKARGAGHRVVGDGMAAQGNATTAWRDLLIRERVSRSPSPHSSEEGPVTGLE